MDIKSVVKLLMPPIVWSVATRLRLQSRTYPTFAAAATAAGDNYANTDLTRITFQKTLIAREKDISEIAWHYGAGIYMGLTYTAALLPSRPLRVLDFGGSFGFHAMVCAKVLPDITTRWAVVESQAVAAAAPPVESDWLRVFTSIDEAEDWLGGVDLMHSSGTIQYLSDPDRAVESLVNLGAPVMLWQRMMFANRPRTHVVQTIRLSGNHNGLGDSLPEGFTNYPVRFPCTYITEDELRTACTTGGYRLSIRVPPFDPHWNGGVATFGTVLLFVRSQR
jgi:putative methyltransferase (TIGR04325 family)